MTGAQLADLSPEEISTLASQLADLTTPQALLANFLMFNKVGRKSDLQRLFDVFETASKIGHYIWPSQIRSLIENKRVVDFGCGVTLYGAVFRALGATSYLGVEPRLNMRKTSYRSRLFKGNYQATVSLADVCRAIPDCDYLTDTSQVPDGRFDIAVMHTVTEHLLDIDPVFASVAASLAPGGKVWFLHDNFYAWAGHHMPPHSVKSFVPSNPDHNIYSDWRHISYQPADDHPFITNLNRIRIDDLRAVTDKYFEIEEWEEVEDGADVKRRLTSEILASLPHVSERELLTRHVKCLARVRDNPARASA